MSRDGEGCSTGPLELNGPFEFEGKGGRCGTRVSVLVDSGIGASWKGSVAAMMVNAMAYRDQRDIR